MTTSRDSRAARHQAPSQVEEAAAAAKSTVRSVYDQIAGEYDERIPGEGPSDEIFTDTEREFLLGRISSGERVLDLGCGTGRFTVPLAESGAAVTGLDLSQGMIEIARRKLADRGLHAEMQQGDMAHMPFPDGSFDTVTSMLALMHIPLEDRQAVFLEVSRVLKPGGRMLLCVKNSVFERLFTGDRFASVDVTDVENKELVFTDTRDGKERTAPWYSFAPDEIARLFARAGMMVSHIRGNSPVSVWLADEVLSNAEIRQAVQRVERALSDVPPFSHLGYHLLAEAVKPL